MYGWGGVTARLLLSMMLAVSGTSSLAIAGETATDVGPPLSALDAKLAGADWLVAWLTKPSRVRPGTIMPDFDPTPEEAQAMAAALYTGAAATRPGSGPWQGGDARTGERLFVERGCRGCHAISPGEASIAPRVPNLAGVGLKVQGGWLFDWLKSPRRYDPATAMPRLVLTDDEIRHLVAYLLARRDGADVLAAAPRADPKADARRGREILVRFECASCHRLPGAPRSASPGVLAAPATPANALANGRLLVARYYCRGCHRIEGSGGGIAAHLERKTLAPPTLEGEGARVQSSWLVAFLRHPQTLRPWLSIRMPDYGLSDAEAKALAAYFTALAGVPAADEPVAPAADELTARGLRRFAHYKCVQCHPATNGPALPAGVDPENLSINLGLAKTRLRPSWMRDFLARPKAIAGTQTRMPGVFYSADGVPKVDDPEEDIAAITAFLLHARESPEAALARLAAGRKAQAEQPATDWTTYQY